MTFTGLNTKIFECRLSFGLLQRVTYLVCCYVSETYIAWCKHQTNTIIQKQPLWEPETVCLGVPYAAHIVCTQDLWFRLHVSTWIRHNEASSRASSTVPYNISISHLATCRYKSINSELHLKIEKIKSVRRLHCPLLSLLSAAFRVAGILKFSKPQEMSQ